MNRRQQLAVALAVLGFIVLIGVRFPAAGQELQREDVLNALLVEVRGLRGAIEHMASASARVQLITSRLQLQEQRINTLVPRLTQQRDRLAAAEREQASIQQSIPDLQESAPREADPETRRVMEAQLKVQKQHLPQIGLEVQRLRAEEAELANLVETEQTRWTTINRQLEELEALLRR